MSEWYELIKDDYYIDFKKNKLVITVATNYNGAIYAELDFDLLTKYIEETMNRRIKNE